MTALLLFVALVAGGMFCALYANQRREDHSPPADAPWTCPACQHPVTTEPPFWTVNTTRYCSLPCARTAWPPKQTGGRS